MERGEVDEGIRGDKEVGEESAENVSLSFS